jgi:predicted PilT family ATPase
MKALNTVTIKIAHDGRSEREIVIRDGIVVKQFAREPAMKIGQFYLDKNNGDYKKTVEEEIPFLGITDVQEDAESITIFTSRPGKIIGRRGENIDALEKYLGKKIKVVETQNIMDLLLPENPNEPHVDLGYPEDFDSLDMHNYMDPEWPDQ